MRLVTLSGVRSVDWLRRLSARNRRRRLGCRAGGLGRRVLQELDGDSGIVLDWVVQVRRRAREASGAALCLRLLLLGLRGLRARGGLACLADELVAAGAHAEPRLERNARRGKRHGLWRGP